MCGLCIGGDIAILLKKKSQEDNVPLFQLNKGTRENSEILSIESREKLNDWNWADYLLYNYFDEKINHYGKQIATVIFKGSLKNCTFFNCFS